MEEKPYHEQLRLVYEQNEKLQEENKKLKLRNGCCEYLVEAYLKENYYYSLQVETMQKRISKLLLENYELKRERKQK